MPAIEPTFLLPPRLSATDLLAASLPPPTRLLAPILHAKSLALIQGPRGVGKTFLALAIARAVAAGESVLGWQASKPRRVFFVEGEMAAAEVAARLALFGPPPASLDFLLADLNPRGHGVADLGGIEGQRRLIETWGVRPDLLILDNLASLVGQARNGAECWSKMQSFLLHLRRAGIAALLVHHTRPDGRIRGLNQREDMLDLILSLRPVRQGRAGAHMEIHFDKARGLFGDALRRIEAYLATDENGIARWHGRPAGQSDFERVAALLHEGLNPSEIARALGIPKSKSYRLREAIGEGIRHMPNLS